VTRTIPYRPTVPIKDPSAQDEQYHTYRPTDADLAAVERRVRRDCPDDAELFLSMLGVCS
jgi:hypothetical protein